MSLENFPYSNEDQKRENFMLLGEFFGISYQAGLRIPNNTPTTTSHRLRKIMNSHGTYYTHQYIKNRVCDAVSGIFLTHIIDKNLDGKLSNIAEDIEEGIDYIITGNNQIWTIDFTQGVNGYHKKIQQVSNLEKTLPDNHSIIHLEGKLLHFLIHKIAEGWKASEAFQYFKKNLGNIFRDEYSQSNEIYSEAHKEFSIIVEEIYQEYKERIDTHFIQSIYPPLSK